MMMQTYSKNKKMYQKKVWRRTDPASKQPRVELTTRRNVGVEPMASKRWRRTDLYRKFISRVSPIKNCLT